MWWRIRGLCIDFHKIWQRKLLDGFRCYCPNWPSKEHQHFPIIRFHHIFQGLDFLLQYQKIMSAVNTSWNNWRQWRIWWEQHKYSGQLASLPLLESKNKDRILHLVLRSQLFLFSLGFFRQRRMWWDTPRIMCFPWWAYLSQNWTLFFQWNFAFHSNRYCTPKPTKWCRYKWQDFSWPQQVSSQIWRMIFILLYFLKNILLLGNILLSLLTCGQLFTYRFNRILLCFLQCS